jgi:hypothetical protein
MRFSKFLLPLLLLAACGAPAGSSSDSPSISSTVPASAATGVAINLPLLATFDRAMDPATVTTATFHLTQGATDVAGTVVYADKIATLTPTATLSADTTYTATITTGSKDLTGTALTADHSWSFTTVSASAPPSVSSTKPADGATNVFRGQQVSATFNKAMNGASLTTTTFIVTQGTTPVVGRVTYEAATNTATFAPSLPFDASLSYTATITTGARSSTAQNLAAPHQWTFATRSDAPPAQPVPLGAAGNYVILAKTQISTVPTSAITGDIGVSPAAGTYITGFSLTADSSTTFSTSPQVTGRVYAADDTSPTSSNLTTATTDMGTAFTNAAGRAPDITELGAGNIGGMTLAPGVYKWGTGLLIPTDVHLVGNANDVWIFDIAQNLTMSSATRVILSGGALPKNVFWQVSGLVDLGTTAHIEGVILCQTAITLRTGASIAGRLLAQSAVAIDASTVTSPAP